MSLRSTSGSAGKHSSKKRSIFSVVVVAVIPPFFSVGKYSSSICFFAFFITYLLSFHSIPLSYEVSSIIFLNASLFAALRVFTFLNVAFLAASMSSGLPVVLALHLRWEASATLTRDL